jgi:hypothetical protein
MLDALGFVWDPLQDLFDTALPSSVRTRQTTEM